MCAPHGYRLFATDGACTDGEWVLGGPAWPRASSSPEESQAACAAACSQLVSCTFFTWYEDKSCRLFTACQAPLASTPANAGPAHVCAKLSGVVRERACVLRREPFCDDDPSWAYFRLTRVAPFVRTKESACASNGGDVLAAFVDGSASHQLTACEAFCSEEAACWGCTVAPPPSEGAEVHTGYHAVSACGGRARRLAVTTLESSYSTSEKANVPCEPFAFPVGIEGPVANGCTDGIVLDAVIPSCLLRCGAGYSGNTVSGAGTLLCVSGGEATTEFLCTPTLCQENEHVSAHECTPCPAGTNNAANDDATLDDTECVENACSGMSAAQWAAVGITVPSPGTGMVTLTSLGAYTALPGYAGEALVRCDQDGGRFVVSGVSACSGVDFSAEPSVIDNSCTACSGTEAADCTAASCKVGRPCR